MNVCMGNELLSHYDRHMQGSDRKTSTGIQVFSGTDNQRLNQQLKFTAMIDQMTEIHLHTFLISGSRRENDAEHSWHIAVTAMLFAEYTAEPVDVGRAVQMCLIHDLIEIRAGETFAYDPEGIQTQAEREKKAEDLVFAQLPEDQGKMMRSLWEEFDAMQTPDAKYAACMDRLQLFLNSILPRGPSWGPGKVHRKDVDRRNRIIQELMPEVYDWNTKNLWIVQSKQAGWNLKQKLET